MKARRVNRNKQTILALWVVLFVGQQPLLSQSMRIDGGVISQERFGFYWETRLMPPTPPMANLSSETTADAGIIHRLLIDRTRQVYVGYDVVIETMPEPNTYRVTVRPLAMNSELARRALGGGLSGWNQMQTPGWRTALAPRIIKGGDVLELELLSNRTTNQSVIDYVTVQEPAGRKPQGFNSIPGPDRQFTFTPGPSRDIKADDVEMTIQSPRLSINGKLDETTARRFDDISGPVVWFATAKRGRFLLSLVPRLEFGFRKAGEVRGSSLSFVIGSDTFTLNSGGRIAPGQAAYTLYVLHEPDFRLTYPDADNSVFVMGADRPEALIRKR
jgi:hypothetical protein